MLPLPDEAVWPPPDVPTPFPDVVSPPAADEPALLTAPLPELLELLDEVEPAELLPLPDEAVWPPPDVLTPFPEVVSPPAADEPALLTAPLPELLELLDEVEPAELLPLPDEAVWPPPDVPTPFPEVVSPPAADEPALLAAPLPKLLELLDEVEPAELLPLPDEAVWPPPDVPTPFPEVVSPPAADEPALLAAPLAEALELLDEVEPPVELDPPERLLPPGDVEPPELKLALPVEVEPTELKLLPPEELLPPPELPPVEGEPPVKTPDAGDAGGSGVTGGAGIGGAIGAWVGACVATIVLLVLFA